MIQNSILTITASDDGAELRSVLYNGTELLWQGDPTWWTGRAPILFPIVGKLFEGSYMHDGRRYTMPSHGFARRSKFALISQTEHAMTFSLCANDDTRSVYPFEFELLVTYKLSGRSLYTKFAVKNQSAGEPMFFSIGGHPAFNCPPGTDETFEDYEIVFNEHETAGHHLINEDDLVSNETGPFFNDTNILSLDYELFQKTETLVFSGLKSTAATLRSRKTGAGVTMDFSGFPFFAVWTKPGAPFVCLEPWQGVDDCPGFAGNLCDKTGIMKLAPKAEHTCGFSITPIR